MLKITLLLLLITTVSFSQIDEVRRITKKLCSEEFNGRGYVNDGSNIAGDYIAEEFKKLGLEPLNGSYFQEFDLDINTFPNKLRVNYSNKKLVAGKHFIVAAESAGFTGNLIPEVIDSLTLLDEYAMKKAMRAIREKKANTFLVDTRNLTAKTEYKMRAELMGLSEYAPLVFLTHQKFTWSVGRMQAKNPILIVQDSIYKVGENFDVDIQAEFKNYKAKNVYARIPAKRKCAKTIVFTAHYDHLGRMGKDTYFPGANDNASGTAMILSMAKYFKENPSKYNMVFIAFAGEEAGLVGSRFFVENPQTKLKKIKFLINLDIMGSGEEGITAVNATVCKKQFDLLTKINDEEGLLKQVKKRGPTQNSDHYFFTTKGVPAFFIYTMGPNKHYHDIFDTYEELSFKEYEDIKTLLIRFVELL